MPGMPTRRARAKPPNMVATIDEATPLVTETEEDAAKRAAAPPARKAPPRAASMGSYSTPRGVLRRAGGGPGGDTASNSRSSSSSSSASAMAGAMAGMMLGRSKEDSKLAAASSSSKAAAAALSSTSEDGDLNGSTSSLKNGGHPHHQKKKLTWNHKVQKKRHPRIADYTPDEIESVWYTENDTKIILAIAKVTVKMMMRGEPCDEIDYCSRGLEGKTPEGAKRRQYNKLKVRKALLEEQEMQRAEGFEDVEQLAATSIKHSTAMIDQAHQVAVEDSRAIEEYKNEVLDMGPAYAAFPGLSGGGGGVGGVGGHSGGGISSSSKLASIAEATRHAPARAASSSRTKKKRDGTK
jgi:hypothetical protein